MRTAFAWVSVVVILLCWSAAALPVTQVGLDANEAPTVAVPTAPVVMTGAAVSIGGIHVADADVLSDFDGVLLVTVQPSQGGEVLLTSTSGLAVYVQPSVWLPALTLVGTPSALNAVLAGLRYRSAADFTGTDSVVIVADDQGFTGSGGAKNATATLDITVTAPATPPVPSFAPSAITVAEDTTISLGASATGVRDGDETVYRAIVAVDIGNVAFNTSAGDVEVVVDSVSRTTSLTGTAPHVAAVLQSAEYTGAADWNSVLHGPDGVVACIAPQADPGTSSCASVSITVEAVNDAPAVDVAEPVASGVIVQQGTPTSLDGVTFSDVDVADTFAGVLHVTVSAGDGQVQLTSAVGLLFDGSPMEAHDDGTFAAQSLSFRGSAHAINTAVATLAYVPSPNFVGATTVDIAVNDDGNTGTGPADGLSHSASIPITVVQLNLPPTLAAPTTVQTSEDTPVAVPNVVIDDQDVGDNHIHVVITAEHGTLSLGTLTYWIKFSVGSGTDDSSMDFTGPLADINAALEGLTYTPAVNANARVGSAADAVAIVVDDQGYSGSGGVGVAQASIAVHVAPVNDAPTVTVSTGLLQGVQVAEDSAVHLSGITVDDVDVSEAVDGIVALTLSPQHGFVSLLTTGLFVAQGVRNGEPDGASGVQAFQGDVTAHGSTHNLQAALDSLKFQGDAQWSGDATVTVAVDDLGNFGDGGPLAASAVIPIAVTPVNDAPTIGLPAAAVAGFTVAEDEDVTIVGIVVSDVDVPSPHHVISVSLTVASGGDVALATTAGVRLETTADDGATVTFTGTLADVNAALATLVVRPPLHWNGDDALHVMVVDGGGGGSGGAKVAAAVVPITVQPVNNAPTVAVPPGAVTVPSDDEVHVAGVSVSDVDLADTPDAVLHVEVTAINGVVSVAHSRTRPVPAFPVQLGVTAAAQFSAGEVGPSGAAAVLQFVATLSETNDLLSQLTFYARHHAASLAADTVVDGDAAGITITVSDGGATGTGGVATSTVTIPVDVVATNRAPVVHAPTALNAVEDVVVAVPDVLVTDPDSGTNAITLTLDVQHGAVMIRSHAGVQQEAATLSDTVLPDPDPAGLARYSSVTLQGTAADLGDAVSNLFYVSAAHWNSPAHGTDVLTITADDGGHSGAGGALRVSATVSVSVAAVNDAPTWHVDAVTPVNVDGEVVVPEDSHVDIVGVSLSDVDANESVDAVVQVTVAADHGVIGLASDTGLHIVASGDLVAPPPSSVTYLAATAPLSSTWTVHGSVAAVNAALGRITYAPDAHFHGVDAVSLSVTDMGNTGGAAGEAHTSVSVRVDAITDAPTLTSPHTSSHPQLAQEDLPVTLAAFAIDARDAEALEVTLAAAHGALSLPSLVLATLTDAPDADAAPASSLTFRGSVPAVTAALASVTYVSALDWNSDVGGLDTVTATVTLLAFEVPAVQASAVLYVRVAAVDDPPTVALPHTAFEATEDELLPLAAADGDTAIALADADVDDTGGRLVVTLAVTQGELHFEAGLSGLDIVSSSPSPPLDEDGNLRTAYSAVELAGSLASLRAAVSAAAYLARSDWSGSDELVVTVTDPSAPSGAAHAAASQTIVVHAVNDPPTVSAPGDEFSVSEDGTLQLAFAVRDVDLGSGALAATLQCGACKWDVDATAAAAAGAHVDEASQQRMAITIRGTEAAVNAALATVSYLPLPDFHGFDVVTASADDGQHGAADEAVMEAVMVRVTSVNDAPTLTLPPQYAEAGGFSGPLGGHIHLSIDVADPDVNEGDGANVDAPHLLTVTLRGGAGRLVLVSAAGIRLIGDTPLAAAAPGGAGDGVASMQFEGPLEAVQAALADLVYVAADGWYGADVVEAEVTDNGNAGAGGALSAMLLVPVTVEQAAAVPVVAAPPQATLATDEDTPMPMSTWSIALSDRAVASRLVTVEVTVWQGSATVSALPAVAVVEYTAPFDSQPSDLTVPVVPADVSSLQFPAAGASSRLFLTALEADMNAALASLTFVPTPHFQGEWAAANGSLGRLPPQSGVLAGVAVAACMANPEATVGGALPCDPASGVSTQFRPVSVAWLNDAPTLAGPAALAVSAGAAAIVPTIAAADVDAGDVRRATYSAVVRTTSGGIVAVSEPHTRREALVFDAGFGAEQVGAPLVELRFSGALSAINRALASLTYHAPHGVAADTITVNVSDNACCGRDAVPLSAQHEVTVSISAVDQAPVVTTSNALLSTQEDTAVVLAGTSVSDADLVAHAVLTVGVSTSQGTLVAGYSPQVAVDDAAVPTTLARVQALRLTVPVTPAVAEEQLVTQSAVRQGAVQRVEVLSPSAVGGTFRLALGTAVSPPISVSDDATALLAVLRAIPGHAASFASASHAITDGGLGTVEWNVTFTAAAGDVPPFTLHDSALTPGAAQVAVTRTMRGSDLGGTFTLSYDGGELGTQVTQPIDWNASAADVATALEALPSVYAPVDVSRNSTDSANGPFAWTITFTGSAAHFTGDLPLLAVDPAGLAGFASQDASLPATMAVTEATPGDTPTSGSFRVAVGDLTSKPVPADASAARVAAALTELHDLSLYACPAEDSGADGSAASCALVASNDAAVAADASVARATAPGFSHLSVRKTTAIHAGVMHVAWTVSFDACAGDSEGAGTPRPTLSLLSAGMILSPSAGGATFDDSNATALGVVPVSPSVTLRGSPSEVNVALAALLFVPLQDFNSDSGGVANVDVTATSVCPPQQPDCVVGTGSGRVMVQVDAVNDLPVVSACGAYKTDEGVAMRLGGVAVADTDVEESDGGKLTATVTVAHGSVQLAAAAGVKVLSGTQTVASEALYGADATAIAVDDAAVSPRWRAVTVRGSGAAVAAALADVQYTPAAAWNSATSTLDVQTVTTSATASVERQAITLYTLTGTLNGTFVIEVDTTALGGGVNVTDPIYFDAVALTEHEVADGVRGSAFNESVQSKLRALPALQGVTVQVTRSPQDLHGGSTWEIWFWTGGVALPPLNVSSVDLECGVCTAPPTLNVEVVQSGHVQLGGSFTLTYGADTTQPVAYDASAADVQAALESLPSIAAVSVARNGPDDGMGYTWTIAFDAVGGTVGELPMLGVDAALLTGTGAAAVVEKVSQGVANPDTIAMTVADGDGSASLTVPITVLPMPSAPTVVAMSCNGDAGSGIADFTTEEDEAIAITGLSVLDPDATTTDGATPGRTIVVTLKALHGVVALQGDAADTVDVVSAVGRAEGGASGQPLEAAKELTFQGALAAVNGALATVVYVGDDDFNGWDVVTVSASVGNVAGSLVGTPRTCTALVTAVNDAPTASAPVSVFAAQQRTTLLQGMAVSDVDHSEGDTGLVRVRLSVPVGSLTLAPSARNQFRYLAGTGTADALVHVEGPAAVLNEALGSMEYVAPVGFGSTTVPMAVSVSDLGNTGAGGELSFDTTFDISVNPLSTVELLAVSGAPVAVAEDESVLVPAFSIPVGLSAVTVVTVVVSADHGSVSLAERDDDTGGVDVTSPSPSELRLRGFHGAVNRLLPFATYTGAKDWNGWDVVTASVADDGAHGAGGAGFASGSVLVQVTPVNDAPTVTAMADSANGDTDAVSFSVAEGGTVTLSGVTVDDIDVTENSLGLLSVTLAVQRGRLALSHATAPFHGVAYSAVTLAPFQVHEEVITEDGKVLSFSALPEDMNAALAAVTYTGVPHDDQDDVYSVTVTDDGGLSASLSVPVVVGSVNSLPTVSVGQSLFVTPEDTTVVLRNLSVSDPDAGDTALRLRVSAGQGTIQLLPRVGGAVDVTSEGDGAVLVAVADVHELALALAENRVTYTPRADFNGRDYVHLTLVDGGGSGVLLGAGADGLTATVIVDVTPVNDVPKWTVPWGEVHVGEEGEWSLSGAGIAVHDVDLHETPGALLSVTVAIAPAADTPAADVGYLSIVLPQPGVVVTGKDAMLVPVPSVSQAVDVGTVLTLTGRQQSIADTLSLPGHAGIMYHAKPGVPSASVSFQLTADDGGATGAVDTAEGSQATATAVFAATVQPSFRVPATRISLPTVSQNGTAVAAVGVGGGGDSMLAVQQHVVLPIPGVRVHDDDVGDAAVRLELEVDHGLLAVAPSVALQLDADASSLPIEVPVAASAGGEAYRRAVTFESSLEAANEALAGLLYLSDPDGAWTGVDYLRINVTHRDPEVAGFVSATPVGRIIAIRVQHVNHAPAVVVPASEPAATGRESAWISVPGVAVSDPDVEQEDMVTATVTATNGIVRVDVVDGLALPPTCTSDVADAAAIAAVSSNSNCATSGTTALELTGPPDMVSAALQTLAFRGGEQWSGTEALIVRVVDTAGAEASATLAVVVEAVDDPPAFAVPRDGVSLTAEEGELVGSVGVMLSDPDAGSGDDVVIVRVWSDSDQVSITVSDDAAAARVHVLPSQRPNRLSLVGTLANVSPVLSALSVAHKALPATAFTSMSQDALHFQCFDPSSAPGADAGGQVDDARAAAVAAAVESGALQLDTLAPNTEALVRLVVTARNHAPVVVAPTAVAAQEDVETRVASADGTPVSVSDSDVDAGPLGPGVLEVTATATNGAVSVTRVPGLFLVSAFAFSPATSAQPHTPLQFRGSLEVVNAALATLAYTGATDYVGPDAVELTVSDMGHSTGTGVGEPGVTRTTIPVQVAGVNDAPVLSVPSAMATLTDEDETLPLYQADGIRVTDVDIDNALVSVELSASFGTLSLYTQDGLRFTSSSHGTQGFGDASMAFEGLLADVNRALHEVRYVPSESFAGTDTVVVRAVDDGGLEARRTIAVTVRALNTAPVITTPDHVLVALEDEAFEFRDTVALADVDASDTPGGYVEVSARAGHGGVLEVQSVRTTATHVDLVQRVSLYSAYPVEGLTGAFTLAVGADQSLPDATTPGIMATAAARVDNERVGVEGSGRGPGESVESALLALALPGVTVDVVRLPASNPGNVTQAFGFQWTVTFAGADWALSGLWLASSTLGDDVVVEVSTVTAANAVGGSFALQLGSFTTVPIVADASPAAVQEALEGLPNVDAVSVSSSTARVDAAGGTYGVDLENGRVWLVTFFAPAGAVDLLVPSSTGLTGTGAAAATAEIVAGFGVPALYNVTSFALHKDQVQVVQTTAEQAITGYFNLALDMRFLGGGAGVATSQGIEHDAVAMVADEARTYALGTGVGQSMQAKLHELLAFVVGNSTQGPMRTLIADMHVTVEREPFGPHGVTNWTITFHNAPYDMPELQVAATRLGVGASAEVKTIVSSADNGLTGSWVLDVNGDVTVPLGVDATAEEVRQALMALESVSTPSTLRVGSVEVMRSPRYMEGGYSWFVAFTQENPYLPAALATDGSSLRGIGAGVGAALMRPGGQAGTLFTVDAIGAAAGGVSVASQATVPRYRGSARDASRVLQSLRYLPAQDWHGNVLVVLEATDHGFSGSPSAPSQTTVATLEVSVAPVNDPPFVSVSLDDEAALTVAEDAVLHIRSVTVGDVDAATGAVELTVSAQHGTVTMAHDTAMISGAGTSTVTVRGEVTEVASAMTTLEYLGLPDFHGRDEVLVSLNDTGHSGVTQGSAYPGVESPGAHVTSRVLNVEVTPVNDKPYVRLAPADGRVTMEEDSVLTVGVISLDDVDATEHENSDNMMTLTLTATHGYLLLGAGAGVSTSGSTTAHGRDRRLELRGSLPRLNAALAALRFTPDANFVGDASIGIVIHDGGNSGQGGPLSDAATLTVAVTEVNDEPVVTMRNGPLQVAEDTQFRVPDVSVADVDVAATGGTLTMTLTAAFGSLTVREVTNQVVFSEGDGEADERMVFTAPLADVNLALASLVYRPPVNWNSLLNGMDTIRVAADDGALVARGLPAEAHPLTVKPGETSTTAVRESMIDVTPVNDAPVLSLPGTEHHPVTTQPDFLSNVVINVATVEVDEDMPVHIAGVTVRDVDVHEAPDTLIEVSLYCSHGRITLTEGVRAPVFSFVAGTGFQDQSVVFRATVANANVALAGLRYVGQQDYVGNDELVVTVSDLGNVGAAPQTGMSAVLAHSLALPLVVRPVNDAPLVVMPEPHLTAFEDAELTILGVKLVDVDAGEGNLTVTVEVGLGSFSVTRAADEVTFLEGDGRMDRRSVFTGPLASLNRALDRSLYRAQQEWNSLFRAADWITVTVEDNGWSGDGTTPAHSDTVFVSVIPSNDAPVWTVPSETAQAREDSVLTVSGVSLDDTDADEGFGSTLEVTFGVSHGTLTFGRLDGLTMLDGSTGVANSAVRFRATLNNIRLALGELQYTPDTDYFGPDALVMTASDRGFTGAGDELSASASLALEVASVNDAPVLVVPTRAYIVEEEEGTFIEGVSIYDVDDAGGSNMTLSLTAVRGVLTIPNAEGNVTFEVGNGEKDRQVVMVGTKAQLNNALGGISYQPDREWNTVLNTRDSITMVVRDGGNTGEGGELQDTAVLYIDQVTGVNDAPVVHVPGEVRRTEPCQDNVHAPKHLRCGTLLSATAWSVAEDEELLLEGVSVSDLDLEETFGSQIQVSVSCYFCSLSLYSKTGLTFLRGTGAGDAVVEFQATLPNANYALRQIAYVGLQDYHGPDNVTVTANDRGFTGLGGALWDEAVIPITVTPVNDQVTWSVPATLPAINEEEKLTLNGITIADVDAQDSLFEVHISVQFGQLSIVRMVGLSFINETAPGSTAGEEVALAIDTSGSPVSADSGWVTAQTANAGEDLSLLFDLEAGGEFGFRGTLEDINTALDSLLYDGTLNFNTADKNKDVIRLYVTDLGSTGAGPATEDWATLYVTVNPKNDAPVVTVPGATFSSTSERNEDELAARIVSVATITGEEDAVIPITGVRVHDVDLLDGSDGKVTMTLFAAYGTLSVFPIDEPPPADVFFSEGTGVNDRRLVFTGTLEAVNAVLGTIWYQGDEDWSGDDGVSITVSDNGYTGEGGVKSDTQVIPIRVLPVNDAPLITVPRHDNGTTTIHVVERASKRLETVMYHEGSAPNVQGVSETGDELWLTRGYQPDVLGQTGMLADKLDGALGIAESWRLSMVRDLFLGSASSSPAFLATYGDHIYFSADNGTTGRELWRSDGTAAGTSLVKDTFPGERGGDPKFLKVFNGLLYFTANGVDTNWMVRTDACSGFRQSVAQETVYYAVAADTVWVPNQVYDCPAGWHWASTEEALDLFPYTPLGGFTTYPKQPLDAGFDEFLTIEDNANPTYFDQCGWDGFVYDGAVRHHFRFADSHLTGSLKLVGGPDAGPIFLDNYERDNFAGIVCVSGEHDRCRTNEVPCYLRSGDELWQSDGTDEGTIRVADIRPGLAGSNPRYMLGFQPPAERRPIMLFAATTNAFGTELWRSDGTVSGTRIVEDIRRGSPGSSPMFLTVMGGLVFFAADDGFRGVELWATDGMPTGDGANTFQVFDVNPGGDGSEPRYLCDVNGTLFFRADDGQHGAELWATEGTPGSTRMVKDIRTGRDGSEPMYLVAYNGRAYFQADDGLAGAELWTSNGTEAGTFLLMDIEAGFASSRPAYLTVFTPRASIPPAIFFTVVSQAGSGYGPGGSEMWRTDGTVENTVRAFSMTASEVDMNPVMDLPHPPQLVEFHNSLFLSAARGRAAERQPVGFLDVPDSGVSPGTLTGLVPQSLSVLDVDAGFEKLLFNLTSQKGLLTLGTVENLEMLVGNGTEDTTVVFRANLVDANIAFRSVIYTARPLENGEDKIVVTVNDTGHTGYYGVVQVSQADVDVWIYEVNDPPTITAPGSLTVRQADTLTVEGIELYDPDLHATVLYDAHGQPHPGRVRLSMWTDAGRISFSTLSGLSFRDGTGIKDTMVVVEGAIDDLNAAVRQLRYVCNEEDGCALGAHSLNLQLEDNGYTGGEPLSASFVIELIVVFNPAQ